MRLRELSVYLSAQKKDVCGEGCAREDGVGDRATKKRRGAIATAILIVSASTGSIRTYTCTSLRESLMMQGRCIDIGLELSLVSSRVPSASATLVHLAGWMKTWLWGVVV